MSKKVVGTVSDVFIDCGVIDDCEKAITSLEYAMSEDVIDIDLINEVAKTGVLYLNDSGVPVEMSTTKSAYKIIPTPYTSKFNGKQLCASFYLDNNYYWSGVYLGTLDKLLEKNQQYKKPSNKGRALINKFKQLEIIKGFSLKELQSNNLEYKNNKMNKEAINKVNVLTNKLNEEVLQDILKETIERSKIIDYSNVIDNSAIIDNSNVAVKSNIEVTSVIEDKHKEIEQLNVVKQNKVVESKPFMSKFTQKLYDRLLIKEHWQLGNNDRLKTYIRSMLNKIELSQKSDKSLMGNGYIVSSDRTKCVFNTGLLDNYNNDLYVIDMSNLENDYDKKTLEIVEGKTHLANLGFSKDEIRILPKPIKFYVDKSELIFNGAIEDFDLDDTNRFTHIIQERRMRFPGKFKDTPQDVLCEKIKGAIRTAVRVSERDYKYIIPMYNIKLHRIQYLLPLHLDTSIDEAPELALVVGECQGFYCVYTILTPDIAYDNARLICRPDSTWLNL